MTNLIKIDDVIINLDNVTEIWRTDNGVEIFYNIPSHFADNDNGTLTTLRGDAATRFWDAVERQGLAA